MRGGLLGLVLQIGIKGQQAVAKLHDLLKRTADALGAIGVKAKKTGAEFQLQMMNMVNSLQSMHHSSLRLLRGIQQGVSSVFGAFAEMDAALARIDIVTGRTGKRLKDAKLTEEFAQIREEVIRLGRDTEFSVEEAADAFVKLRQYGLTTKEALASVGSVMAYTSAGAGKITLAQAAETAALSIRALNTDVKDIPANLDKLTRGFNSSAMSVEEWVRSMRSAGPAAYVFKDTKPEEIVALIGMIRSFGRTAKQAGNDVMSLNRAFAFIKDKAGVGTKRFDGLREFLGVTSTGAQAKKEIESYFLTAEGEYKNVQEIFDSFREKSEKYLAKPGNGRATLSALLLKAFGTQQMSNIILAQESFFQKTGQKLSDYTKTIRDSEGEAKNAQDRWLQSAKGRLQILSGEWDTFRAMIGETLSKDGYMLIDFLENTIHKVGEWVQKNPELVQSLVKVATAVTSLVAVFAVATGAILIASYASLAFTTAAGAGTAGLGVFGTVVSLLTRGLAGLTVGLIRTSMHLGFFAVMFFAIRKAWRENFGGIRVYMQNWGKDIRDVIGVIQPLLSGEGIRTDRWDKLSARAQNIARVLVMLKYRAEEFKDGFVDALTVSYNKVRDTVAPIVSKIRELADQFEITAIEDLFSWLSNKDAKNSAYELGVTIANVVVVYVGLKLAVIGASIAISLFTTFAGVASKVVRVLAIATRVLAIAMLLLGKAVKALVMFLVKHPVVALIGFIVAAIMDFEGTESVIRKVTGGLLGVYDAAILLAGAMAGPVGFGISAAIVGLKKLYEILTDEKAFDSFMDDAKLLAAHLRDLNEEWTLAGKEWARSLWEGFTDGVSSRFSQAANLVKTINPFSSEEEKNAARAQLTDAYFKDKGVSAGARKIIMQQLDPAAAAEIRVPGAFNRASPKLGPMGPDQPTRGLSWRQKSELDAKMGEWDRTGWAKNGFRGAKPPENWPDAGRNGVIVGPRSDFNPTDAQRASISSSLPAGARNVTISTVVNVNDAKLSIGDANPAELRRLAQSMGPELTRMAQEAASKMGDY